MLSPQNRPPLASSPAQVVKRVALLALGVYLVGASASHAQTDPFKNAQATYMNIFSNVGGLPGAYIQGVNNYGAVDLVVLGNSTVATPMIFKPNSLIYTGQTNNPKQLRYYEALTFKEIEVTPGMSNASIVVNVTNVSLPTNTKFFVICKTLSKSYAETSVQKTQITNTGRFTNTLTGLTNTNRVGNYLQVGFQMEGITQTNTNSSQVGLAIVSRTVTGRTPTFPATTTSQLLRNGDFNISTNTNYFVFGAALPDDYFWQPFLGAYVGDPANVSTVASPTGGKILILDGEPIAGSWYNGNAGTEVKADGGKVFTLSFDAFFPADYSATTTSISFWNDTSAALLLDANMNNQIAPSSLGAWRSYRVRYTATDAEFAALVTGKMRLKIQPQGRVGTALFDNFVLRQQTAAEVGPQLAVSIAGADYADGSTGALFAPLIGYTTPYTISLRNDGSETLVCPSVSLSGTSFVLSGGSSATLEPGESRSFFATATPTDSNPLAGTLTVLSNDKEVAEQNYVVNLQATPLTALDDFTSGTAASLGWKVWGNEVSTTFDTYGSVTVDGGALWLKVDSQQGAGTYPWFYAARKTFAAPGTLDLTRSSIAASLRAFGKFSGAANNKVQVYLESLNSSGAATGRVSLGQWVDETTLGSDPGVGSYFEPDGIDDRVAVLLPEGGDYTSVQSTLSAAISQGFNPDAVAYRLVVMMTDFEFDLGPDKIVELDSIGLTLVTKPFEMANGGFETDSTDFGTGTAPTGWRQFPADGVNKNLVANGTLVYNATTGLEDPNVAFQAYAGTKATKIYGQNYYLNGTWVGPSQSGVVYQEWPVAGTADILPGQAIHARGAVKVFGIDLLTGGSTFNFGFRYLNDANVPVSPDEVTTITASTDVPDQWVALVANGTVPAGATKVQLIAEFVQNNSTDTGAAYLDDVSVGLGVCPSTKQVDSKTYQLVWSDEFDGSSLNTGNWTPETGDGGWGNNEVQTYTANPENLRVKDGSLVIQAVKSNGAWTSARIKTQDKRIFKHGLIEFRAKLPTGVGPWSAAWMMGNNFGSVGWPTCGEIDVLEWRGYPTSDANTVGHALHSPQRNGGNPVEADPRSAVSNPSTQFHTYGALWKSDSVTFSVDGVDKATLEFPVEDRAAFQKEFFLLLNMAIGGTYLQGQIDPALNGATYEVDYVRVYQDLGGDATSDTTPPVITIQGANPVSLSWGTSYVDGGATAFDAGDNASVPVVTVNPVDSSVPGEYSVTYTAQDSKGNSTNTNRLVNVIMANNGNNVGADGFTDSLRYALGGTGPEPLKTFECPSSSITPGTNGTKNLVMTYFARTNENVSLLPWASANLASSNGWTTNGIIVTILSNVATNGTILEKRQATTPATNSQKFMRLRSIFTQ